MMKKLLLSLILLILFNSISYAENVHLQGYNGTQSRYYDRLNTPGTYLYPQNAYKQMENYIQAIEYNRSIEKLFVSRWEKPQNLSGHKQVTLVFKRTKGGVISNIEILKTSGSAEFDNSVINVFKSLKHLPYDVRSFASDKTKPYSVDFTVDYNNGKTTIFTSFYMGESKRVGIRTEPLKDIKISWYVNDLGAYALLNKELEKSNLKDYGLLLVSVDVDNNGNYVNPYIKISSGSNDFDNLAISMVKNLNSDDRIRKTPNNAHTVEIMFSNFDNSKLSNVYNDEAGKELEKYKNEVLSYITSKWKPPLEVRGFRSNYTSLLVEINRDGTFVNVDVASSSGNAVFDNYAVKTVRNINKYKPLPKDYDGESIKVFVTFMCKIKW